MIKKKKKSISFNSVKITEKIQSHTEWKGQPHTSHYTMWGAGGALLTVNSAPPTSVETGSLGKVKHCHFGCSLPFSSSTSEFLASPNLCVPGLLRLCAYCILLLILRGHLCRCRYAFTCQLQRASRSWVCILPEDRTCVWVTTDTGNRLPPRSLKMWWINGLLLVRG